VRIMGSTSTVKEDKAIIEEKFRRSCERNSVIAVPLVAVENIKISPDSTTAIAEVYYRFELTRADGLPPIAECSKEVYSLRKVDDNWIIVSNIDWFSDHRKSRLISDVLRFD